MFSITFPDLLVIGGFASAITGVGVTLGEGPALIVGGVVSFWVGVMLFRGRVNRAESPEN
jgi:hypothetical protein